VKQARVARAEASIKELKPIIEQGGILTACFVDHVVLPEDVPFVNVLDNNMGASLTPNAGKFGGSRYAFVVGTAGYGEPLMPNAYVIEIVVFCRFAKIGPQH